ncbi:MAG: sulfatase-like hydrolase/transferase [Gammaproteobacteria bacterium]|nr:sulfatase-like hydrolase/transferase [Gammaproteobacteria bacterium]
MLFRLLLITLFFEQAAPGSDATTLLTVLGNGLRYDISTAGAWVVPTFLLSLSLLFLRQDGWLRRLRGLSARLYVILAFTLFGVDILYFDEYGDQFDNHIFGIVHDDTTAILITVWKEYHPLLFVAIVTPLILANLALLRRWLGYTPEPHALFAPLQRLPLRLLTGVVLFLFLVAMVRGGTLNGEPIRLKHAFVVEDMFLNRTVLNPFAALRYTLKTRLALETGSALKHFWPDENLGQALDLVRAQRGQPPYSGSNIEEGLSVNASGHHGSKPRHLFLLLLESHSGWTVMPAYRQLGLSPELSRLADAGIYFPNFLPASSGTIGSMNALITGFPDAGLNINYEPSALQPYGSSLAAIMRLLGYRTRFFYGGFISWQRLDSFAQNQGFDEIYGGGAMSSGVHTNEWGVDDKYLYDFILDKVDDETPSFNFILTTSNHPPYDLPLAELGYHLRDELPAPLTATKEETVKVLGHLWYADQQGGRFVREVQERLERPLFAITGDHTARLQIRFPGDSVAEQSAVPLILYGPEVLGTTGNRETAGAHIDIAPTLIELAADKGFAYPTFGENMLAKKSPSTGLGWHYLMSEHYIANDAAEYGIFALAGGERPAQRPDLAPQRTHYNALRALSWQRIKKGNRLLQ